MKNSISDNNIGFGWVVTITSLAFVVSQLDVSIVNIALPAISKSLSADLSTLQWIIDAYTLAFAVLMLSAGSLSDLLGATRIFQLGVLIFGIASAGCGLAWSAPVLIISRAVQGIGAATMIPSSLAILNQAFAHDKAQRAHAVALWTAAGGVAIAAGPILGGLLIKLSTWRLIFFVNVPLCLAALLLSVRLGNSKKPAGGKLDIPGQVLWMLALTALIAVIIESPKLGFHSPLILGWLFFSILMFITFIRVEKKKANPMLPLGLFSSSSFNSLILVGMVLNSAYYGTVFILSLYLQKVLQYPPLVAGLAFLPLTAGFIISNLFSSKMIAKYGIRTPILIGLAIFAAGFAGLFFAKEHTHYLTLVLPFFVIPLGMGLAIPVVTNGILGSVDKKLSGTASAVLNTARQAAGAMGVAIFGAMAGTAAGAITHAITISACIAIASALCVAIPVCKFVTSTN